MGMMIDNTCEPKPMSKEEIVENLKTMGFGKQAFERFNAKERETLDRAWNIIDQYENRLKADMVAMFKELQLEIEKLEKPHCHNASHADGCVSKWKVEGVIQQKIDKLKEGA